MGLKQDLEEHIRTSYAIIHKNETIIQTAEPKESARLKRENQEQWQLIQEWLDEYLPLCQSLGESLPRDIEEIAARFDRFAKQETQKAIPSTISPSRAEVFVGREREKNEFQHALNGVLGVTKEADWAQVFFIWGEGGMGKSVLLGEYAQMCEGYKDQLFWLYVDWELAGVDSQSGTPKMMVLMKEWLGKKYRLDFPNFHEVETKLSLILKKVDALRADFRGNSLEEFDRYVKTNLLDSDYSFYNHRERQRKYSEAFVADLCQIAVKRPVILMFDTYETVWHFADEWVREGLYRYCLGNPEVGRRFIIIIAGRLPEEEVEFRHRDSVRTYVRPLAYFHKALDKFTEADIRDFLLQVVPDRPLSSSLVSQISLITRGIPLAVSEIAALIRDGSSIEQIFEDVKEPPTERQVLSLVTQRFLKHCLGQQTPQRDRDRDCIYTFAIVRQSEIAESGPGIMVRRDRFLRDIWFKSGLIRSNEDFCNTKQYLQRQYSFLLSGGEMHSDVRNFIRKALHQAAIEQGKLMELNEAAKIICDLRIREREEELEAQYGPERAEREKYRDLQWQEWLLDLVNHCLWLQMYGDVTKTIINVYVMAVLYGSEGFHRRLLSFIQNDELFYNALPARNKEFIDRLSNLSEWSGEASLEAEKEQMLGLLESKSRIFRHLIAARAAIDAGAFEAAQRQISQAEQLYGQEKQRDPTIESELADAYHLLGRRLASSSKKRQIQQDVLIALKRARDWSPDNPHIYSAIGNTLLNLLRPEEARLQFEKALELSGGINSEAKQGLERAKQSINAALFHPGKQARILTVEGDALSTRGEFKEAKKMLRAAKESDPSYVPAYVKLSHLLRTEGDLKEALQVLSEIHIAEISASYLRATIYDAYGATYLALEQLNKAVEAYQMAINLSPEYINPLNGLGRTYIRLGKAQEGIETFKQALEVRRRNKTLRASLFWVHNGLGMAYLLNDQPNGAVDSFLFAESLCRRYLEKETLQYYTLANLGIALLGQHRYEESLEAFKCFAAICQPRGLVQELLADVQLIGRYGRAQDWQPITAFLTCLL